MLEQRVITEKHQKWIVKLSRYDFDIIYRTGRENGEANALSQKGEGEELQAIAIAHARFDKSMFKELREDPEMV